MTASLLLGSLELIGTAVNPEYRLGRGLDLGAPEPDTATIGSLLLDGDAVSGNRYHNRTITLTVCVHAPGLTGPSALTSQTLYTDTLMSALAQDTFTLQWTPDGGLPVVLDCFRARAQRQHSIVIDGQGWTTVTFTCQAKPFGRSPLAASVAVAGTALQTDDFESSRTGSTLDATVFYQGTHSARIALAALGPSGARTYATSTPLSQTYGSAGDFSAMSAISLRMRWPAPGGAATMTATLTLLSAAGNTSITASRTFTNGDTAWRFLSFPLTGNLGSLNRAAVTGYTLTLSSTAIPGGASSSNLWVDDQRMVPASSALVTTTHATNLIWPSIVGSARSPVNLALSTGGTFGQFLLHTPPGDQDPDAQILLGLSSATADQTITIPAANANLRGTFSLILGGAVDGSAGTFTVTVTQKENGSAVGAPLVLTKTWDITTQGLLCPVGEVTLPLYDTPAENSLTSYTVRVDITAGTDRYSEVMLADTTGQTIFTDAASPSTGSVLYVDEPSPLQSGPSVYISSTDRTAAWSKLGEVVMSGGPILLDPGINKVLAWTDAGTPALTATYYPRWLDERVA